MLRCLSAACRERTAAVRAGHPPENRPQKRAALILHGLSARSDGKRHFDAASFHTLRRDWVENNPDFAFDVYLHSWAGAHETEVIRITGAKRWAFEEPKRDADFFDAEALSAALLSASRPLKLSRATDHISPEVMAGRLFSRFYSLSRSVQLAGPELDGYDMVLLSRFDLISKTPLNLSALDVRGPRLFAPMFSYQEVLEAQPVCKGSPDECSVYLVSRAEA